MAKKKKTSASTDEATRKRNKKILDASLAVHEIVLGLNCAECEAVRKTVEALRSNGSRAQTVDIGINLPSLDPETFFNHPSALWSRSREEAKR